MQHAKYMKCARTKSHGTTMATKPKGFRLMRSGSMTVKDVDDVDDVISVHSSSDGEEASSGAEDREDDWEDNAEEESAEQELSQ